MTANHLVLAGQIVRASDFESAAGISHRIVTLEHRSQRWEAGLLRNVYCQMQVVFSGDRFVNLHNKLNLGVEIQVEGFIFLQQSRNGQNRLVLHAENVELKT